MKRKAKAGRDKAEMAWLEIRKWQLTRLEHVEEMMWLACRLQGADRAAYNLVSLDQDTKIAIVSAVTCKEVANAARPA